MRISLFFFTVCFLVLSQSSTAMEKLSLSTYLDEVKKTYPGFKSSVLLENSSNLKAEESSLITSPNLFTEMQLYDDGKQTIQPQFSGTHTNAKSVNLGVSQLFSFGLQSKLYYKIIHTELQGATFAPYTNYYTHSPVLEVSQPLWGGAFGKSIQAKQAASLAQQQSNHSLELFKQKQILAQAEIAYWNLIFAKKSTHLRSETFERSKLIVQWTSRRANLNLGDRVDFLQAQAAFQTREIELKSALVDEKSAEIAFFNYLNKPVEPVSELSGWDSNSILALTPSSTPGIRDDVVSAQYLEEAIQATSVMSSESIKPDLQLYGSLGLNGLDSSSSESFKKASGLGYRTWIGGVKLNIPLSFGTVSDLHQAYAQDRRAAELNTERTVKDSDQQWRDLREKFSSAQERLKLALELEKTQKEKLLREQTRLKQGRTTAYQELVFEQDYSLAIGQRLQIEFQVLTLFAQLKLFNSSGASL